MTTAEQVVSQLGTLNITMGTFKCDFCKKSFSKETTLRAHSCEKKRRWQAKDNQDVLVGFGSYESSK